MRLDNTARMNLPGTAGGNWAWRIGGADVWQRLAPEAEALRALADTYGRLAPQPVRGSVTQHGGARRSSMASATCPSAQGTVRWPAVECKQPHLFSDKNGACRSEELFDKSHPGRIAQHQQPLS